MEQEKLILVTSELQLMAGSTYVVKPTKDIRGRFILVRKVEGYACRRCKHAPRAQVFKWVVQPMGTYNRYCLIDAINERRLFRVDTGDFDVQLREGRELYGTYSNRLNPTPFSRESLEALSREMRDRFWEE